MSHYPCFSYNSSSNGFFYEIWRHLKSLIIDIYSLKVPFERLVIKLDGCKSVKLNIKFLSRYPKRRKLASSLAFSALCHKHLFLLIHQILLSDSVLSYVPKRSTLMTAIKLYYQSQGLCEIPSGS